MKTFALGLTVASFLLIVTTPVRAAQPNAAVKPLDEAPAIELPDAIRNELAPKGWRFESNGATYADVWIVKALPLKTAVDPITWSAIEEGTLLGAMRFPAGGATFRGHTFKPGVVTLRYGIQPADGNHLGVSAYREFGLAVLPDKDNQPGPLDHDTLVLLSKRVIGISHPAIFSLVPAPATGAAGSLVTTSEGYAGVLFEFRCRTNGQTDGGPAAKFRISLILIGRASE